MLKRKRKPKASKLAKRKADESSTYWKLRADSACGAKRVKFQFAFIPPCRHNHSILR
jgi:hypothetical protein